MLFFETQCNMCLQSRRGGRKPEAMAFDFNFSLLETIFYCRIFVINIILGGKNSHFRDILGQN